MQTSNLPALHGIVFAASGTKNTIPDTPPATPGMASYQTGFPPVTMTPLVAGGIPPLGADFNGILNSLSAGIQWDQAGAAYPYNSAFSTAIGGYPLGSRLLKADGSGWWISSVENNASNPDTGGANWIGVSFAALAQPGIPVFTLATIPTSNIGNAIMVSDGDGMWQWVSTAYFTGYRHPHCGMRVGSAIQTTPASWQVDSIGGNMSKTSAIGSRIFSVMQENGLVVASGSWVAGSHWVVDNGDGTFKLPDLRRTYDGATAGTTDPDTANVVALGAHRSDQIQNIIGGSVAVPSATATGAFVAGSAAGGYAGSTSSNSFYSLSFDASRVARTGTYTAPRTTASYPRIHAWSRHVTANVVALGARKVDQVQNITGSLSSVMGANSVTGAGAFSLTSTTQGNAAPGGSNMGASFFTFDASRVARAGTYTAPTTTAAYPRLHAWSRHFTANVIAVGAYKIDQLQNITGQGGSVGGGAAFNGAFANGGALNPGYTPQAVTNMFVESFDASRVARTGSYTAPRTTASYPRIHA